MNSCRVSASARTDMNTTGKAELLFEDAGVRITRPCAAVEVITVRRNVPFSILGGFMALGMILVIIIFSGAITAFLEPLLKKQLRFDLQEIGAMAIVGSILGMMTLCMG